MKVEELNEVLDLLIGLGFKSQTSYSTHTGDLVYKLLVTWCDKVDGRRHAQRSLVLSSLCPDQITYSSYYYVLSTYVGRWFSASNYTT